MNEGATSYLRFPVFLAPFFLLEKFGLEAEELVGWATFLFLGTVWAEEGVETTERLPSVSCTLTLTG